MGLDLAEIFIEVEEEFEIEILGNFAAKIETVGNLVDCVEQEIRKNEVPEWKAEQVYAEFLAKTKSELATVLKVPESQIDLGDRLDKLIPGNLRREIWGTSPFFQEIGSLTLSCRQHVFAFVMTVILGVIFLGYGRKLSGDNFSVELVALAIATIVGLSFCFLMMLFFMPAMTIKSKAQTVSDCARMLAAKEGVRLNREGKNWTHEQIELRVRQIISDVGGIKLNDVKLEYKLCEDLQLG